jgi:CubicO group peptidase (beta-lactamase class C family)
MLRHLSSCLVLVLTLAGAATAQPPDLDRWVARAMQTFDVPGIGLAIVQDDQVVVAKGFGVRKLGDPAPVDARTLFGIASNTKVFTATALGLLVGSRRLNGTRRLSATCRDFRCGIRSSRES